MNIVGISAFYHDSACSIIKDGILAAAAEEERFSRVKADSSIPGKALKYCLKEANITIDEIDCIAYYENPQKKLARQLWSGILGNSFELIKKLDHKKVETQIREVLGYNGLIKYYDHHLSHAASSFYFSGFKDSAILTVDGVGEWATTTYGIGNNSGIEIFDTVEFPDSLGLLYSTITSYLGFGVNDGEYKVMGLAPYGRAQYLSRMRDLIQSDTDGQYRLNMKYFGFLTGKCMYSSELPDLFGAAPRQEDSEINQFHKDIAKSLQVLLEEILLEKSNYLYDKTHSENLCMAGGVALNCVANGHILRNGPFKKLFVQPAANDAGCALGAAACAHIELSGNKPPIKKLEHVYLGPSYNSEDIIKLLKSTSIVYSDFDDDPDQLPILVAQKINEGKVIGWFQGRMEFGPRSLGARSILADPRNAEMRDRINAMVKKREGFRPFAPAVLEDKAKDHFEIDHSSPFMLETCQVKSTFDLPAITHVDGSARVQTVNRFTNQKFHDLLEAYEKLTGCPIILNTSFNIKGEPIVCTPEDAIKCFITTDIDCLVIENIVIDRSENNNLEMLEYLLTYEKNRSSGISHDVYTFI